MSKEKFNKFILSFLAGFGLTLATNTSVITAVQILINSYVEGKMATASEEAMAQIESQYTSLISRSTSFLSFLSLVGFAIILVTVILVFISILKKDNTNEVVSETNNEIKTVEEDKKEMNVLEEEVKEETKEAEQQTEENSNDNKENKEN